MRDLEHQMADATGDALEKVLEKYQNVQHEFDLAGGYAWQHKMEATLLGVGLGRETWEQKVGVLSGGQRSRLALAKLLLSRAGSAAAGRADQSPGSGSHRMARRISRELQAAPS